MEARNLAMKKRGPYKAPPSPANALGVEMTVSLREVTADTVRVICALQTTEEQKRFVAPNALSIAQAHFEPAASFRAIYAGETPIGFLMWRPRGGADACYLWRFMIAAQYQRRGHGRSALSLLADTLRNQGVKQLSTSYVPGPEGPHDFYLSFGFEDTGKVVSNGEQVMVLRL
jgi:diamine N-acetyltransferase